MTAASLTSPEVPPEKKVGDVGCNKMLEKKLKGGGKREP